MAAYPRKQTLFIFIICALITGGTAFYVYGQYSEESKAASTSQNSAAVLSSRTATSTTPVSTDWKKQFLNTSTSSTLKASNAKPSVAANEKPLTATDQLSRNFLTKYSELQQAGLISDPETVSQVMGQVVTQSADIELIPKEYTAKDLTISSDTPQNIVAYKNIIKSVSERHSSLQDEAEIAVEAFEMEDMSLLVKIDPIINEYKGMISRLLSTPVPEPYLQHHLDLINGMSVSLYSTQAFRHIDTDAIRGFASVRLNAIGFMQIRTAFSHIL
jgi:hypothetical protein